MCSEREFCGNKRKRANRCPAGRHSLKSGTGRGVGAGDPGEQRVLIWGEPRILMELWYMWQNWQMDRRVFGRGRIVVGWTTLGGLCLGVWLNAVVMTCSAWAVQDETNEAIQRWQTAFGEMQALNVRARSLPSGDQSEFRKEYTDKLQALTELRKEIEPQLLQTVQDSTEIPQPLHDTLLQLGRISLGEDNYIRGFRLLKPLVDSGSQDETVYQFAALAAFGSDQFKLAGEWIEKFKANGGQLRIDFLRRMAPGIAAREADWKVEEAIRAAEAEKDDLPRVKFETAVGDIVIELFEDQAPNTVANFITLVEKGYYDGLTFHRVLPQFMAQGGCPNGTGGGGPGYTIPCECHVPNYRKHFSGTLSMAHAGRDTGGSQFFLTFVATPHLDGQHTAFGRVIEGMEAVASLSKVNPEVPNPAIKPSTIVKATVLRKRDHDYQPKTLPERR
jgi:cyclophilin family peptidyl-prolyl cis-trans isomerase